MPQFLAALLLPLLVNSPVFFLGPAAISAVASGLGYLGAAAALFGLNAAFAKKPDVPKPEDGKYNLRQSVPSPSFIVGTVLKGADYLLLEEKSGVAWHVLETAGHRINGYVAHRLHDEEVVVDGSGVVALPDHFDGKVRIRSRVGLDAETAFAEVIAALPTIWTADHRGDGVATLMMSAKSVGIEDQQKVYPQSMPVLTSIIEGALLYDGRDPGHDPADHNSWTYSENLALARAWHLCHPVGAKLTIDDLEWSEWTHAADVCDQTVQNKAGDDEPRYHGGFWFRASDDPIAVGRTMDQAAELIIYETAQGKIGVHAGEFVEPDIRLTEDDILSVNFDANRRQNSTVLAVRGRFTDPEKLYNTVDAAIVGNPYLPDQDSTERTKTLDNVAVQRHNHIQRLQTLAYIRSNAPRVRVVAHYEAAENVPFHRFVRVHKPPRLNEAVIELTGRPKLSLRDLTYEFEGIVIPDTLYAFVAATDEGEPPPVILELNQGGVPTPEDFEIEILREAVTSGQTAAYAVATWTHVDDTLRYELEWQAISPAGLTQRTMTAENVDTLRSGYLADEVSYQFRLRAWSSGTSSNWTDYQTIFVTAVRPSLSFNRASNSQYLALLEDI